MEDKDMWHLRLAQLRRERGLSLRSLAGTAGVSPATLSAIERGESSPTLATLQRILRAAESDFASFFTDEGHDNDTPVFRADRMMRLEDSFRSYVLAFPKRADIRVELVSETILPGEDACEWERHKCDMAGVVVEGEGLTLEMQDGRAWDLARGDAFYVRAGQTHRGVNRTALSVRVLTVYTPPRY